MEEKVVKQEEWVEVLGAAKVERMEVLGAAKEEEKGLEVLSAAKEASRPVPVE